LSFNRRFTNQMTMILPRPFVVRVHSDAGGGRPETFSDHVEREHANKIARALSLADRSTVEVYYRNSKRVVALYNEGVMVAR